MGATSKGIIYPDPGGQPRRLDLQTLASTADTAIGTYITSAVNSLGVWQSYSPVWTATTTNPTLGNGTLTGRWTQIGRTVHFTISLRFGSTTNRGTGSYRFSLPRNPSSGNLPIGTSRLTDVSNSVNSSVGIAILASTSEIRVDDAYSKQSVAHNWPFTWATDDLLGISGTFEASV